MPTIIRINGKVAWRAFRDPHCDRWVAACDALGLVTDADTWSQLQKRVTRHLSCLLDDLLQENRLDAFLSAHGWTLPGNQDLRGKDVHYDIPIELMIDRDQNARSRVNI